MKFGGICITTDDSSALAEFYKIIFQEEPVMEGSHYSFSSIAIYNPGDVVIIKDKSIWIQCFVEDLDKEYTRLLREIPNINIISPPKKRPWGAYSFWFFDLDGNKIAVAQHNPD